MRNAIFVLAIAGLSACANTSPTDVSGNGTERRVREGSHTTVGVPPFVVSIPDTIMADPETGVCDVPVKIVAGNVPQPAYFDSGSATAGQSKVEINGSAMRDLLGPIVPNSTQFRLLEDAIVFANAPHSGATYLGNLVLSWWMGGVKIWAYLEYWCVPHVERPPVQNPPAPPL